ncbi:hypothetical protein [Streptomyces sp. NPDC087437]|uniref:effector-associated constant component EACC1 n=1 Tax=Streptomyces sp. NPDC087437 TaxID=3365789 RepID=UPI00381158EB
MRTIHAGPAGYRVAVIDEDPLRARREARELLAVLAEGDAQAALDVQGRDAGSDTDKGGPVTDLIGLVFGGGSLAASGIQIWLARVPQRTVVVTRPDGATLRITGREARADDEQIERFLNGPAADSDDGGPGEE